MWGMIIETTKQKVQTSGNIQSASCTIDAEDMRYIASLLRNNYSDTILATMREIIANGIDVSNGRKVDVQLPTRLEPNFIVRDYGCGLSEEDMMGLYTKYGKSTKRDSNNAIGGFGIGRFAPLSYADSFIVMSVCDGQKTAYTIRVDENDDTVVSKMFSESTKEDNGIYVQVPVQIKDIQSFKLKFKNLSQYLGDKINLLNEEFENFEVRFSCDTFDYYRQDNYYDDREIASKPYVLMGGILYPVVADSKYPCFKNGVVYKAEIGEFKLHHSREALEYNDKTVVALKKASEKIQSDVEKYANDQIKDSKCLYDATKMFAKFKPMVYNLVGNFKSLKINWGDFPISEVGNVFLFENCDRVQKVSKTMQGNFSVRTINRSWNFSAEPSDHRYFIIDDGVTPRSPHNRLSWLGNNEEVYLINLKPEFMDRFKAMNDKHVSLLSSHERTINTVKSLGGKKGNVKKADILLFKPQNYPRTNSDFWSEAKEEFSDDQTYYYYVYNANKVELSDGYCQSPYITHERLKTLRQLDSKIGEVYGVRKKALKKIEKKSNWIRMDKIEQKIVDDSPVLKSIKRFDELRDLVCGYDFNFMTRALEKSPSKKIILNFKKLLNDINKMECPERIYKVNLDRIKIDLSKEVKIKEDFLSAYPMVKHLANSHRSSETIEEDLVSYLTKW